MLACHKKRWLSQYETGYPDAGGYQQNIAEQQTTTICHPVSCQPLRSPRAFGGEDGYDARKKAPSESHVPFEVHFLSRPPKIRGTTRKHLHFGGSGKNELPPSSRLASRRYMHFHTQRRPIRGLWHVQRQDPPYAFEKNRPAVHCSGGNLMIREPFCRQ